MRNCLQEFNLIRFQFVSITLIAIFVILLCIINSLTHLAGSVSDFFFSLFFWPCVYVSGLLKYREARIGGAWRSVACVRSNTRTCFFYGRSVSIHSEKQHRKWHERGYTIMYCNGGIKKSHQSEIRFSITDPNIEGFAFEITFALLIHSMRI